MTEQNSFLRGLRPKMVCPFKKIPQLSVYRQPVAFFKPLPPVPSNTKVPEI